MSLTLGEKLRQAREERGFTISEVAEQTRISSLYLQSIENDDYNTLPGGIFNKGFVKSFAKFVGINEQEALEDYSRLISHDEGGDGDEFKVFRPEVLTDDRSTASMAPTIIIAAIILALMTIGVLFLVDYVRQPASELAANTQTANKGTMTDIPSETSPEATAINVPDMNSLKVEFTALSDPVALLVTADGKTTSTTVSPNTSVLFEPKGALKLSYSKSLASVVQLTVNGKKITLPAQPISPRRNAIEIEINKENLSRIWESGSIQFDTSSPGSPSNANLAVSNSPVTPLGPARPISSPPRIPTRDANSNTGSEKPAPGTAGSPKATPAPGPAKTQVPPSNSQL